MGAVSDGEAVEANAGDLVWKQRSAWHTFWNGGDTQVRILEVITPGDLVELFRAVDRFDAFPGPDELQRLAASTATWTGCRPCSNGTACGSDDSLDRPVSRPGHAQCRTKPRSRGPWLQLVRPQPDRSRRCTVTSSPAALLPIAVQIAALSGSQSDLLPRA
jgi:hypothetical protein